VLRDQGLNRQAGTCTCKPFAEQSIGIKGKHRSLFRGTGRRYSYGWGQ
jgi:hypothetical protein